MPCLYFLAFLLFRYTASRRPPQQHRPTSRSSGCRLGHQLASATGSVEKNESIFAEASAPTAIRHASPKLVEKSPIRIYGRFSKMSFLMFSCFSSFQLLPLVPVHDDVFYQFFELAQLCQHGRALGFLRLSDLFPGVLGKAAVRASASRPLKRSGTWVGSCCGPSSPHSPRRISGRSSQTP